MINYVTLHLLRFNFLIIYSTFLPREAMLSAVFAVVVCLSVCLCLCVCVCVSVTLR